MGKNIDRSETAKALAKAIAYKQTAVLIYHGRNRKNLTA